MKSGKSTSVTAVTILMALAIAAHLRLSAQDQPQDNKDLPGDTVANANYNFLIASGFLCDPDDSAACPAVARTSNGETIEISGAGTLGLAGKSVTAVGAFTEKTPTGAIVTTGVWTATGLVSFESYGIAPRALLLDYPKLRTLGLFPMGKGMMPGPMAGPIASLMAGPVASGGLAVIRIRLVPDTGSPLDALLRVNCAKGKVPADEPSDGVRLAITGGGPVFDEEVSGRTVFLLQRPMPNFASKQAAGSQGQ
jgi:hypothetical protein